MKIKNQLLSTERARHASAHETLRAFRCWSTSLTLLLGQPSAYLHSACSVCSVTF